MLSKHDCRHQNCEILMHPDNADQCYCMHCNKRFHKSGMNTGFSSLFLISGVVLFVYLVSLIFAGTAPSFPKEEVLPVEQQVQVFS